MAPPRSVEDWKALIAPHLSTSLRDVSDALTRTDAVQNWLHDASMEAAEGLGRVTGMQGKMQGYMRMMDALEDRFPNLLAAVDELTEGCGTVDLHWRPMNPNFSRVQVTFDRDFTAKLFVRLDDLTPASAQSVLDTVSDALPQGAPFPNRPNTVTGLVAYDGACLGVRVREQLSEDGKGRYRTVTLLPASEDPLEHLSVQEAAERLRQLLASADAESAG
ncbi:MAG: hypothetical protein ABEK84_10950 [Salinibacter sp.]